MALQHTTQTDSGVTLDAYIRVVEVWLDKHKVNAHIWIMADSEEKVPVERRFHQFDHDLNGENAIKQSYLHIKTLPEYAGAIDV